MLIKIFTADENGKITFTSDELTKLLEDTYALGYKKCLDENRFEDPEKEKALRLSRQRAGMAAAKAKGVTFGRPKVQKPDNWDEVIADWKEKKITSAQAMALTGVKRTRFYQFLSEDSENEKDEN